MNVTINTDASFNPEHKVGAFAFWISSDYGKVCYSDQFKKAECINDCEIKAIGNALHALVKMNYAVITHIYINTDSTTAISRIKGTVEPDTPEFLVRETLKKLADKHKMPKPFFTIRHVKAHSGKHNSRKYVNDWCDKEARRVLRLVVKQKLAEAVL